uniref:Uncharacterized protein n=1 Tax=Anopheles maculatus TaxID=74869 RepID=A0A182SKL6_9DIPT
MLASLHLLDRGPIGASIVAMCPKNVGLHTNPALAMCKPTFEVRPPSIAPTPMMLVPRDSTFKPTVTTPTTASGPTALGNATSINNNSTTVLNNNTSNPKSNSNGGKPIANSTSQCNIVKSASGQLTNAVLKSNGTTAKETSAEEKSFL